MKRAFTSLVATACVFALTGSALAAAPATAITPENAGQVVELKRSGEPTLNDAIISPDGRLVAVATSLTIELRDANKLSTVVRVLEGESAFQSLAFSQDGQLVAGRSKDGVTYVWQTADGKLRQKLPGLGGGASQVAFSRNSQTLTVLGDSHLEVWNLNGKLMQLSKLDILGSARTLNKEGDKIATSRNGNFINVLDRSGSILYSLEANTNYINAIAFSEDGRLLAAISDDGSIILYSTEERKLIDTFRVPEAVHITFSSDSRYLIAFSFKNSELIIFDCEKSKELTRRSLRLDGYSSVGRLSSSRDAKLLRSDQFSLHLSQISSIRNLDYIKWPKVNLPDSAAFSTDGDLLFFGEWPNIRLTRVADGRFIKTFSSGTNSYSGDPMLIAVGPSKNLFAFALLGALDNASDSFWLEFQSIRPIFRPILIINSLNSDNSIKPNVSSEKISSLAFSSDEQLLAYGSADGSVRLLRTSDGAILRTLNHSKSEVSSISFSTSGQLMATASLDGVVRIWQIPGGRLIRELPRSPFGITNVLFGRSSNLLAVSRADNLVQVWQVEDGRKIHDLDGQLNYVKAMAFSSDDRILAAGDLQGVIHLWSTSDGRLLKDVKGHADALLDLAFDGNGQLVTVSRDGTIRLWGVK